jgi:hypothetical protein
MGCRGKIRSAKEIFPAADLSMQQVVQITALPEVPPGATHSTFKLEMFGQVNPVQILLALAAAAILAILKV